MLMPPPNPPKENPVARHGQIGRNVHAFARQKGWRRPLEFL